MLRCDPSVIQRNPADVGDAAGRSFKPTMQGPDPSIHATVGTAAIADFAEGLYRRIADDAELRPMFSADIGPGSEAVRDMRDFLVQFFGGPQDYSERKGHPRLRARHLKFSIDQRARDAWLVHALAALQETTSRHALTDEAHRAISAYLHHASQFMVNRPG